MDFSCNLISQITNLEGARNTLISLDMSKNMVNFDNGYSCLGHLPNLVVLNLSQNQISTLTRSGIEKCGKLEELDVSSNSIPRVDGIMALQANTNLKMLSVEGNPFSKTFGPLALKQILPSLNMIDKQPAPVQYVEPR